MQGHSTETGDEDRGDGGVQGHITETGDEDTLRRQGTRTGVMTGCEDSTQDTARSQGGRKIDEGRGRGLQWARTQDAATGKGSRN